VPRRAVRLAEDHAGEGQTAGQLFVRTHTFNPNQARAGGMTADKLPAPVFFDGSR
jgi:hypothetical protein